ncbi:hypothetical protein NC651_029566 [Populus alba x Populus x berolinensis]|nr:hypothetical protein NC651_029566 [Populus alba x Populus x berolinensis]
MSICFQYRSFQVEEDAQNRQGDFIFRLPFTAKMVTHVAAPRHATYRFLMEEPNSDMVEQRQHLNHFSGRPVLSPDMS